MFQKTQHHKGILQDSCGGSQQWCLLWVYVADSHMTLGHSVCQQ